MQPNRVVQIRTAGKPVQLSSGYLISSDLVLACEHGLASAQVNDTVFVRGISDLKKDPQDGQFAGTILWKGDAEGIDASLIVLPAAHPVRKRTEKDPPPRLAQLTEYQDCKGIGFPAAVATQDDKDSNNYPFDGRVSRMGAEGDLLVDLSKALPDAADWGGISGSAVFCGRAIVGIMRKTHQRIGNSGLRAIPIEDIFQNPEFLACVEPYGLKPPVPYIATFDVDHIRNFVCSVDRREATKIVTEHLASVRWPAIVVIDGASKQKHERFIERLARFEMKNFLEESDMDPERMFPELGWPSALRIDPIAEHRSWLQEKWKNLGNGFSLPENLDDLDACAEAIKASIDRSTGPHGFSVSINENTAVAGSGHGAFLKSWGTLWQAVKDKGVDRPFIIFICRVDSEPSAPDLHAPRQQSFWKKVDARLQAPVDPGPTWNDALVELGTREAIYGADGLRLEDMPFEEVEKWIGHVREIIRQELEAPAIYCEEMDEMFNHLKAKDPGRRWSMVEFDDYTNTFFITAKRT